MLNKCYPFLLVSVLHRNRTNRMCIYVERFILKNWLTQLARLGKSEVCSEGQQAGDPGKSCSSSPKAARWQNSFFLRGSQSLFS